MIKIPLLFECITIRTLDASSYMSLSAFGITSKLMEAESLKVITHTYHSPLSARIQCVYLKCQALFTLSMLLLIQCTTAFSLLPLIYSVICNQLNSPPACICRPWIGTGYGRWWMDLQCYSTSPVCWPLKALYNACHVHPLTHTFIRWWQGGAMQGASWSSGAIWGSVQWRLDMQRAINLLIAGWPALPPELQHH